jgi:hypothetical protein
MGNEKQRQPASPVHVAKKPAGQVMLWQSSDGSLYIIEKNGAWDRALIAEYGEKWAKEIGGLITKETLNAVISLIKTAPGEGAAAALTVTGLKIVAKGISSTLGDAIAGKEITAGTIGYNIYSEMLKPTNWAPGGKVKGTGALAGIQNEAYLIKDVITTKDPFLSKLPLPGQGRVPKDYKIKADIGIFSIGKQAEKKVVKYIKKLGHKPDHKDGGDLVEYDISSVSQNWDVTDLENFDRFMAQGYSLSESIAYTNSRTKGLSYDISQLKTQIENTEYFGQSLARQSNQQNYELWNASGKAWKAAYNAPNAVIAVEEIAAGSWYGLAALAGELLTLPATALSYVESGFAGAAGSSIKIGQVTTDVVDVLGGTKGGNTPPVGINKAAYQPNTNLFSPGYMGTPFLSFRGVSSAQVSTNTDTKVKKGTAQVQTPQRSANKTKKTNTNLVTLPAGGAPSNSGAPIYGIKF